MTLKTAEVTPEVSDNVFKQSKLCTHFAFISTGGYFFTVARKVPVGGKIYIQLKFNCFLEESMAFES